MCLHVCAGRSASDERNEFPRPFEVACDGSNVLSYRQSAGQVMKDSTQ